MAIIDAPLALFGVMFFSGWLTTIFSIIFVLALIIEVANEKYVLGYVSLFGYSLALAIFTNINPFAYAWHNPWDAAGFVFGYFAIGAIYSIIKYRPWLSEIMERVREIKLEFIKLNSLNIEATEAIPAELTKAWQQYLANNIGYTDYNRIKSGFGPGSQKELILNWIAFWPFSAVGLLIAEPLEKLVNWIYSELIGIYKAMYRKIVSKYINLSDIENLK